MNPPLKFIDFGGLPSAELAERKRLSHLCFRCQHQPVCVVAKEIEARPWWLIVSQCVHFKEEAPAELPSGDVIR